jgi:hypothetical protein
MYDQSITAGKRMSRYSQLYIDQPMSLPDSKRARHRLGKQLERLVPHSHATTVGLLWEQELGVAVGAQYNFDLSRFCDDCAVRDLLDIVTLTFGSLRRQGNIATQWLEGARRIFSEERLAYEIDHDGVVHPAVDKEFQRNRQATVAGLQTPRYANSLAAFERISDELAKQPPSGKDAWRAVFTAVEGLFRLMYPSTSQLNAGTIESHLAGVVQKLYQGDAAAQRAGNKQVASFKDWVDASHNYRHEAGSEELVQPPIDLAVLGISNGTSYLRWLIAIDQATLPKP